MPAKQLFEEKIEKKTEEQIETEKADEATDDKNGNAVEFEVSEEVKEKMENAESLHELIDEEALKDLSPVAMPGRGYRFIKRTMDMVLSGLGILVLLLPLGIISLAVFIDDPGKVLFRQYRVGRGGKRFRLYKFRSMKLDTPKYMSTAEVDDPDKYITRVGKFLRKTSLDEIPQLFNVFKGDMSLVGPRPLISDEYEIHQMRTKYGVYQIRPGVTGLAQINGRDTVSPAEKVRWDVKYLEHFGLLMDLKILFATVPKVFGGQGVVEGYSATPEKGEKKADDKTEEASDGE